MKIHLALLALLVAACGHNSGNGNGTDAAGTTGDGSNGVIFPDAPFSGMCTASAAQCSNCMDDDGDGKIDGFDPECTGPLDNDEATFATGIPGDNKDSINQDCFFDGDSGGGNDGCNQHVCCLLGAQTKQECIDDLQGLVNNPTTEGNKYNKDNCYQPLGTVPIPQQCIDVCGPISPPGCDCFGCCVVCDPMNPSSCVTIDVNPAVSPDCTPDTLTDPTKCKPCTQNDSCGNTTCGGATCILCPGQDPSTLPPECNGSTACPTGSMACGTDGSCPTGSYCSNGCCIGTIQ